MKKHPTPSLLAGVGGALALVMLVAAIAQGDWLCAGAWASGLVWTVAYWFAAEQRATAWSMGALHAAQQFALMGHGEYFDFVQIVEQFDDANPYTNELKRVER